MEQRKPSCGLIYSGCGSAGMGAERAGFEIKFLCDDRSFIVPATWEYNFKNAKHSRDIKAFRQTKVDLLIGSPPCSRYSLLNRTRTRMDLYATNPAEVEYTAFLNEINIRQPKFFILENLVRIKSFLFFTSNPDDPTFYVHFLNRAENQMQTKPVLTLPGYRTYQYVLNTSDFGLAQVRKRLFIIGAKKEYPWSYNPPQIKEPVWLNTAIRDIKDDAPNHQKTWLTEEGKKLWRKLKYGERTDANRKIRKMAPKQPCATIIGSSLQYLCYYEPRYLTPRECCRIHGFFDDFILSGSTRQQLNQVGKSIAPPIAESLSRYIFKTIQIIDQSKALDQLLETQA